jgi:hypothetical protein
MARKMPSDITQFKIRIREDLRLRLEAEARKRDVSVNYEMRSRLEQSFERKEVFELSRVAEDIRICWAKWGDAIFQLDQQDDLVRATERLIASVEQFGLPNHPEIKDAIDKAREVIVANTVVKLRRNEAS